MPASFIQSGEGGTCVSLTGLQEPGTSSSALSLLNSHLVWVVVNTWPEAQAHFPLLEMNWLRLA